MDATVDSNEDEEVPAEQPPRKTMWAHPRLYTPSTRHPVGKVTSRGGAIRRTSTTTSIPSGSACRRRWPVAVDIFGGQHHHSRHGGGGESRLIPGHRSQMQPRLPSITYQQTPNRPQQTPTCEQRDHFLPVVGKRLLNSEGVKLGKDKVRHGLDGERLECVNYHDWVMGETGLVQLRGIVFPSSTTPTSGPSYKRSDFQ